MIAIDTLRSSYLAGAAGSDVEAVAVALEHAEIQPQFSCTGPSSASLSAPVPPSSSRPARHARLEEYLESGQRGGWKTAGRAPAIRHLAGLLGQHAAAASAATRMGLLAGPGGVRPQGPGRDDGGALGAVRRVLSDV